MNTQVGRIARQHAHVAGLAPSLEASPNDEVDDDEDDANSFGDDKMMTSQ